MSEEIRNAPDDSDSFVLQIQSSKIRAELIKLAARAQVSFLTIVTTSPRTRSARQFASDPNMTRRVRPC
jgi:hypothetical protein